MIKTREQLRADADADVAAFAELIAGQEESTGIPKPPKIDVSEIALAVKPFNFGIIEEPETEVFEGPGPPGGEVFCPSFIFTSFSGVIFDCGCFQPDGSSGSEIVSGGTFNSATDGMTKGFNVNCLDQPCVWNQSTHNIETDITLFAGSTDCSTVGIPSTSDVNFLMVFDGSLYHLFAYNVTALAAIFYGTTANLSSPISNILTCSATPITFGNPAVICLFGTPQDLPVVAHDGTANLVF